MVAIQLMDSLTSCSAFCRQGMGVRKPHWTQLGAERIVGEPLVDIRIEPLHVREHSVGDIVMEADDDCVRGAASGHGAGRRPGANVVLAPCRWRSGGKACS